MPIKLRQVQFNPDGTPMDKEAEQAIKETTEELGFGPDTLIKISKAMPPTMNGAGVITIIINMMANYDMLPNSGVMIIELTKALRDLKDTHPDFFEEGGVERHRAKVNSDFRGSLH